MKVSQLNSSKQKEACPHLSGPAQTRCECGFVTLLLPPLLYLHKSFCPGVCSQRDSHTRNQFSGPCRCGSSRHCCRHIHSGLQSEEEQEWGKRKRLTHNGHPLPVYSDAYCTTPSFPSCSHIILATPFWYCFFCTPHSSFCPSPPREVRKIPAGGQSWHFITGLH